MRDRHIYQYWALYLLICGAIFFVELLPLQTQPGSLSRGDPLVPLTMVWVLRRPELLPIPLIVGVFFLADLLLQRPPGLFAALALIGCLFMMSRGGEIRRATLAVETSFACATLVLVYLGYRLILFATLIPVPSLLSALSEIAFTMLYYPIIALLIGPALGIRYPGTSATEGMIR